MTDRAAEKPSAYVDARESGHWIESDLVKGCRGGDPEALRQLMEIHSGRVLRLLRNIVSDPLTAEGLAQEAFMKVFRGLDKFKVGTNLRVWILTITRNTAYDHLRREKKARLKPVDLSEVPEPVEPRPGPEADMAAMEETTRMRNALKTLPLKEREVVLLRVYESLTWDNIAAALSIPEATARARMNRALERLRARLNEST